MIVHDKNKDSCSTVYQNFTSHPATLPRGIIGYIKIPITQTTPPHYRVHEVNSLIHSVIHAYHPDTTIPIRQNGYTDMNLCTPVTPQSLLEIIKIEINDKSLQLPIPSVTGKLRPSDKIRKDLFIWMSIFIHDCIECQQNKDINQKIQTATKQTFSENASNFNYRISMDTKGPINPPSKQNSYIHVIVDAFSHFVVTVPVEQNNARHAVNSLLHHWITKFEPPIYLVTDRGSEYINDEFANLCTTMGIRHSQKTLYAPWTNGLVENQNKNFGTHLRRFLHNTPENWPTQVLDSQPLSELNFSPYEIVFILYQESQ